MEHRTQRLLFSVRWGFSLTPTTQYHWWVICLSFICFYFILLNHFENFSRLFQEIELLSIPAIRYNQPLSGLFNLNFFHIFRSQCYFMDIVVTSQVPWPFLTFFFKYHSDTRLNSNNICSFVSITKDLLFPFFLRYYSCLISPIRTEREEIRFHE